MRARNSLILGEKKYINLQNTFSRMVHPLHNATSARTGVVVRLAKKGRSLLAIWQVMKNISSTSLEAG